jgi:hypothetical protein
VANPTLGWPALVALDRSRPWPDEASCDQRAEHEDSGEHIERGLEAVVERDRARRGNARMSDARVGGPDARQARDRHGDEREREAGTAEDVGRKRGPRSSDLPRAAA